MPHPLDPLSAAEISQAVAIFRTQHSGSKAFFSSIGLVEPPKASVKAGASAPRIARLLGVDESPDGGFAADVNLDTGAAAISRLPGNAQAPYGFADLGLAVVLTKQNEAWLKETFPGWSKAKFNELEKNLGVAKTKIAQLPCVEECTVAVQPNAWILQFTVANTAEGDSLLNAFSHYLLQRNGQ